MNRRRFGAKAFLAMAAATHMNWSASTLGFAAQEDQVATPEPESRCIPALAVSLGVGQVFTLERSAGRTLTARFVAVEDDSRCPVSQGTECVWAGQAMVVVEIDRGGGSEPDVVRFAWVGGSVFQLAWGHQGFRLFVVAVGLSGDSATPREDLVLDLIVLPDWPRG